MEKILSAYCKEAGMILTIEQAREFYFSQDKASRKRLSFCCDDPICKVPVIGVNYDKLPTKIVKSAHYRENKSFKHSPECKWHKLSSLYNKNKLEQEGENDYNDRLAKQKLSGIVNYFLPTTPVSATANGSNDKPVSKGNEQTDQNNKKSSSNNQYRDLTTTSSLYRITSIWRDALSSMTFEERNKMILNVRGIGRTTWGEYFKRITRINIGDNEGIIYAGVRNIRRYGCGFKAEFYDKLKNKNIYLYVSPETMKKSKLKNMFEEIIEDKSADYFEVYVLNPFMTSTSNSFSIEIEVLKNLAIYRKTRNKS